MLYFERCVSGYDVTRYGCVWVFMCKYVPVAIVAFCRYLSITTDVLHTQCICLVTDTPRPFPVIRGVMQASGPKASTGAVCACAGVSHEVPRRVASRWCYSTVLLPALSVMTDLVAGRRCEDLEKRTRQHGQDCVVGIGLPPLRETESRPAVLAYYLTVTSANIGLSSCIRFSAISA